MTRPATEDPFRTSLVAGRTTDSARPQCPRRRGVFQSLYLAPYVPSVDTLGAKHPERITQMQYLLLSHVKRVLSSSTSNFPVLHQHEVRSSPGPMGVGTVVRQNTSHQYYPEVRIIPTGSRSDSGPLIGVGPGLCKLRRTPLRRSSAGPMGWEFSGNCDVASRNRLLRILASNGAS
jgi:hypothetical protein